MWTAVSSLLGLVSSVKRRYLTPGSLKTLTPGPRTPTHYGPVHAHPQNRIKIRNKYFSYRAIV